MQSSISPVGASSQGLVPLGEAWQDRVGATVPTGNPMEGNGAEDSRGGGAYSVRLPCKLLAA